MNLTAKSFVIPLGMGFVAAIFFGVVGVIGGGLTPSEGQPSLVAWFIWCVVPITLTIVGLILARPGPVKIFLFIEFLGIFSMTLYLLLVFRIV